VLATLGSCARRSAFLSAALLLLAATSAVGAPCESEDFETRASGESECLVMRRYGPTEPATMVVWLHGNITGGGPANAHFAIAQKAAVDLAADRVMTVALVRPGYPDGSGAWSSGNDYDRGDNFLLGYVAAVGSAIERLRLRYRPETVIIVGHSGGAAMGAVLLGLRPKAVEAAVLVACPCDLVVWRARKRGRWIRSEDPVVWIGKVSATARVITLTGTEDAETPPELGKTFAERLKARGIDATFQLVPGAGHVDVLRSPAVSDAIASLLRR
jgi:pimeloyl-ACP methyl ester carboxylesterase